MPPKKASDASVSQHLRHIRAFLLLLLLPALVCAQVQLRTRVEQVLVPVSAKDKNGRLALGLTQTDFTITEAGKKQNITSFSIEPVPISAVILIDTGISENALNRVKSSFPALTGAFADDDEIAVFRFDKHVEKLMDFSSDRALLEGTFEKLTSITATVSPLSSGPFSVPGPVINGVPVTPGVDSVGRTIAPPTKVLHDAIFQAAEDLGTRPVDRRKIVLLASDGRNQNSLHSYNAALDRLLLREVHVFAFGVETSVFQRVRSDLLSYTKATGGEAWFPESQGALESCYFLSTEEARNQYVLGYVSTNKRPTGPPVFREIKVQANQPGIELRHKKGYYQGP
jgi:VWFA-related protein